MRKMTYPKGSAYKQAYLNIFGAELAQMQIDWDVVRNAYPMELRQIHHRVEDILTASYAELAGWYIQFKQLSLATRNTINAALLRIFDYDKWSFEIAEYFKNPLNGFRISSCHYCDMAYINAFEVNPYEDGLYKLNNAPADELQSLLKTRVPSKVAEVKRHHYNTKADFEAIARMLGWQPGKFERTFPLNEKYKHHFDLDHVLPKAEFLLVGLSLYNFVPSCQICNQRLKRSMTIGINGVPKVKLSPTSPTFDLSSNVEFHVLPKVGVKAGKLRPTLNPQDYDLQIDAKDPDYDDFIKLFKLEERYQQHKGVALHWLEMKTKYNDARINMMERSLDHRSFSFTRIKSDIFQNKLYDSGSMSFSKLREDMLK